MDPGRGYPGYHPAQPNYPTTQQAHPGYNATHASTSSYYPGYTSAAPLGSVNATPYQTLPVAQPSTSVFPATPTVAPLQSTTSIPSSLFLNVGIASPSLLENWPTPTGTLHDSLFDSSTMKEQAEKLIQNPSQLLVQSVIEQLAAISPLPAVFNKVTNASGVLLANNPNGPKIGTPTSLQKHVQHADPSAFVSSSRRRAAETHNLGQAVCEPSTSSASSSSHSQQSRPVSGTGSPSHPRNGDPPIIMKFSLKNAKPPTTSELPPAKKLKASSECIAKASPEYGTPLPPLKIKVPNPLKKKREDLLHEGRDENRYVKSGNMANERVDSPEIFQKNTPMISQSKPLSENKQVEERSDPLISSTEVFDPCKLTLKISSVSVDTASEVFWDVLSDIGVSSSSKPIKSAHRAHAGPSSSPRNTLLNQSQPFSPEVCQVLIEEHPVVRSFSKVADRVLRHASQCDISHLVLGDPDAEITDSDIPSGAVMSHNLCRNMVEEATKLKSQNQAQHVPIDKLREILVGILPTILYGYVLPADLLASQQNLDQADAGQWRELLNSRVIRGAEAAVAALSIMTSPKVGKDCFNADVTQAAIRFAKRHLPESIYPAFDPLYRCEAQSKDGFVSKIKQKRARGMGGQDESTKKLYSRFEDMVVLFAELVALGSLEEPFLYSLASLGVSPFFVENVQDLQLKSLKLVANIFAKYEKLREVICDDILSSLARLPSSKRNLRSYVISSTESIQMISALILHLVQSIAKLPSRRQLTHKGDVKGEDFETTVLVSYDDSTRCAQNLLTTFFTKCATKGEEDFRPLFENFIVDLLVTINRPAWPAAESLLSVLGVILLKTFNDKAVDANFRYASIESLGLITSRMRKDSMSIKENPGQLQDLVTKLYQTFNLTNDGALEMDTSDVPDESNLFQQGLLQYLWQNEPSPSFAASYYLVQWYHDAFNGSTLTLKDQQTDDDDEPGYKRYGPTEQERNKTAVVKFMKAALNQAGKGASFSSKEMVDAESAKLIARQFASTRQFATSFDKYFREVLRMAADNTMQIRIRAMKAASTIIDADSSLMGREDVKSLVESRMWDTSAQIRENVVEMIGKYSVLNPQHLVLYQDVLLKRLMDTAPSVRKRAIKVLHDFCVAQPEHDVCGTVCKCIIKRINDEETIKKLVYEVFQSTWFDSTQKKNAAVVVKRVQQILEVVKMLEHEKCLEWFEKMLKELLKKEAALKHRNVHSASKYIVECLMNQIVNSDTELTEKARTGKDDERTMEEKLRDEEAGVMNRVRFQTLKLFAKCSPDLVMPHVQMLPPYLSLTMKGRSDQDIFTLTANVLTLVVPMMRNPPDLFLAQIEESCAALFLKPGVNVEILQANVECLAAVVNNATFNYKIVRDIYEKFWQILVNSQLMRTTMKDQQRGSLLRALCIVSLLVQYFDLDSEVFGYVSSINERLIDCLLNLLKAGEWPPVVQQRALQSLGFVFIRKAEAMTHRRIIDLYTSCLSLNNTKPEMKRLVLQNLVRYLEHEEAQVVEIEESATANEHYNALDLKGNQTASAELPRKIIYNFLKSILECGVDEDVEIRRAVLNLVSIIVRLRYSHPQMVIPFLISVMTEAHDDLSTNAVALLEEIHRKYPGSLATKTLMGVRESFLFQRRVASKGKTLIRGFKMVNGSQSVSLIGYVYKLLRPDRNARRMLINSLLDTFKYDDSPLDQLLYFADNIAYFPFQAWDEPLFVIHQIDPILAMICPAALHRFRKSFRLTNLTEEGKDEENYDEDEMETAENLKRSLPADLGEVRDCYRQCQPSFLLISIKKFLENYYSITADKVKEYKPTEPRAVFEKPIASKKTATRFAPTPVVEFVSKEAKGTLNEYLSADLLVRKFLEFKMYVATMDDAPVDAHSGTVEDDVEEMEVEEGQFDVSEEPSTSDVSGIESSASASESSSLSSPVKRKTAAADSGFKKPRTPRKRAAPGEPKRPRGRPRKTPQKDESKKKNYDASDDEEEYLPS